MNRYTVAEQLLVGFLPLVTLRYTACLAIQRPKTTDPLTPLTPLPSRSHTGQSDVRHLSGRTHMMHQIEGHGTSMRRVSLESHSPINLLSDAIPTSDARGQEWRKKGR